jgi:hypothetical protein
VFNCDALLVVRERPTRNRQEKLEAVLHMSTFSLFVRLQDSFAFPLPGIYQGRATAAFFDSQGQRRQSPLGWIPLTRNERVFDARQRWDALTLCLSCRVATLKS